jgi:hypothetical protein
LVTGMISIQSPDIYIGQTGCILYGKMRQPQELRIGQVGFPF